MKKSINEIIDETKKGLTDDIKHNILFIDEQISKYRTADNAKEILTKLNKLALEIMPEEKKQIMQDSFFIGKERIDRVFAKAQQIIYDTFNPVRQKDNNKEEKSKKFMKALDLIEPIILKIEKYFSSTDDISYFSFQNPFEDVLYRHLFLPNGERGFASEENDETADGEKSDKNKKAGAKIRLTPFNFSEYYRTYGFLLIEFGKYDEATAALEKGIKMNPVNPNPYFELAEVYKVQKDFEMFLFATKDILKVAYTVPTLARAYCNLGFYAFEKEDFESSLCFYSQSAVMVDSPEIAKEIKFIREKGGMSVKPPTAERVDAAFKKYGLAFGANPKVVSVAYTLAKNFTDKNQLYYARLCLSIVAELTNDSEVKALLKEMDEQVLKKSGLDESKLKEESLKKES
ncbi:MAG: tetratricopeptide repeat protein [Ruminococcus sp.]|jgi:tetratricopeptide (TPR) repeat protein|nr:tetratricopeptide repeat protein [Ruminococcus sp.]